MKKYLLFLVMAVMSVWSMAQDTIMRTNRDFINAKVEEVGTDIIRYRKASNIAGPIYNIATSDVAYIIYSNGSRDEFNAFIEDDTLIPPIIIEEEIAGKAVIAMLNGTEIAAIVEEVGIDKIRYRKVDNPTGPVYAVNVSEVLYILYDNGIRDEFNKPEPSDESVIEQSTLIATEAELSEPEPDNSVNYETEPVVSTNALKIEEVVERREPIFGVGFYYAKPIGPLVWSALYGGTFYPSVSEFEADYGDAKRNAFGMWGEAKVYGGIRLFFDMIITNELQEFAEPGEWLYSSWSYNQALFVGPDIEMPDIPGSHGAVYLAEGLTYNLRNTGFRFGTKIAFGKKYVHPYSSFGYGLYQITSNYYTSDLESTYGSFKGNVNSFYYAVGVEFEIPDVANLVVFFENNGPDYEEDIQDLFYPGWNWTPFDVGPQNSMGSARIGIGLSMF